VIEPAGHGQKAPAQLIVLAQAVDALIHHPFVRLTDGIENGLGVIEIVFIADHQTFHVAGIEQDHLMTYLRRSPRGEGSVLIFTTASCG
jgi:hypothetical protein